MNRIYRLSRITLIPALLTCACFTASFAQSSGGPFTISSHVVASGGCGPDGVGGCTPSVGSGNLTLEGTAGEPFAGTLSSESPFSLRSGFWYTLEGSGAIVATPLIISEFRLFGTAGANDEFIEIYNNSDASHFVAAPDGSSGYAIAASDGVVRCMIPNGTMIPARGHFLCVNAAGYSLSNYPASETRTATGDATYSNDIADNTGIALFQTAIPANFSSATRSDAVGSTSEANSLYKEGAGYPALTPSSMDYSFVRSMCSFIQGVGCSTPGIPKDTNDNAADFLFVDTQGTNAGAGQRLGAPGPENLSSPIQRNVQFPVDLLDRTASAASSPNRLRDSTSDPPNNSSFGTLTIRRRVTNNTGAPVTRLRFRIVELTTFASSPGIADLRARTSSPVIVSGINDPLTCPGGTTPCSVTVAGTTVESPPAQPPGGGINSSLSAGTVTLTTPLAPGASINVHFLLGVQQTGTFRFLINIEALP